jgi:Common central domain of tyrosinase
MASPDYTTFRQIEGPHGAAHVWVGGFVGNASIAPRDPVFWLIHANVDRLWAEWINTHSAVPGFQALLPLSGATAGHNLNDTMWPWNGTTSPFGVLPWTVAPENVRPADLLDHSVLGYGYDTVDAACKPVIKLRLKELKDRLPKEFVRKEFKEGLPKELQPKERLPKELQPKELQPKELQPKELQPKELQPKELQPKETIAKEIGPKEFKEIREGPPIPGGDPFIRPELRPDLTRAALAFEPDLNPEASLNPDIAALQQSLLLRRANIAGPG